MTRSLSWSCKFECFQECSLFDAERKECTEMFTDPDRVVFCKGELSRFSRGESLLCMRYDKKHFLRLHVLFSGKVAMC
jgi:hypothetical protein